MPEVTVNAQQLTVLCTDILTKTGVPAADAHLVGDSLVQADLWGHPSHGVLRLLGMCADSTVAR